MLLKEQIKPKTMEKKERKRQSNKGNTIFAMAFCVIGGVLFSGVFGGGVMALCAPICASVSAIYGMCIFAGSAVAYIFTVQVGNFAAEVIAMPLMVVIRTLMEFVLKRKPSCRILALMSGVVYAGANMALFWGEITLSVIAAAGIKGIFCALVTYFISYCAENFLVDGHISVTGKRSIAAIAVYILVISALVSVRAGNFSIGRVIGMFVILAAGGRFGISGGAVAGTLTALGMILGESGGTDLSDMVRSSVITACAGLAAGVSAKKGRTLSSVVFILINFALVLFMGRFQWITAFMTDTVTAAVIYCFIPDRFYMRWINRVAVSENVSLNYMGESAEFVAEMMRETLKNVSAAAETLGVYEVEEREREVLENACDKVCAECRSDEICCKGRARRKKYVFPCVLRILKNKGYVTENEMPKELWDCPNKDKLSAAFNDEYYGLGVERRITETSMQMWEYIHEQLAAQEDMLREIGDCGKKTYDERLSERAAEAAEKYFGKKVSAAVYFDSTQRIYISCFLRGVMDISADGFTDKLASVTDRDLDKPEVFGCADMMRISWHEFPIYMLDTGKAVKNGREDVSGDNSCTFSDGYGNICYIISDGMGSGKRAALESSMAVSMLKSFIKAGMGINFAVRTVNLMLAAKSSDEVFTTADIMRINIFTGRTEVVKLGAAQTLFSTGGVIKLVECRTLPMGIMSKLEIEKRIIHLSDGDSAVMLSDGIDESVLPKVREYVLSDGYSPQRCADMIMEISDKSQKYPPDDKTVFVVRLHKI